MMVPIGRVFTVPYLYITNAYSRAQFGNERYFLKTSPFDAVGNTAIQLLKCDNCYKPDWNDVKDSITLGYMWLL